MSPIPPIRRSTTSSGYLSPCSITRICDPCVTLSCSPCQPILSAHHHAMFDRSGWKARADREVIKRREYVRCKKVRNLDGQLRHRYRCRPHGEAWSHFSFGPHEWEKGKNMVTFWISVLTLPSPSFTSSSS